MLVVTLQGIEDNMQIIETTAPISIDNLKKYFIDKDVMFLVDYTNSQLKGQKLLTYVSNLDIPCDIMFDTVNTAHLDLLKEYFHSGSIVNLKSLELAAIECLLEYKGIIDTNNFKTFISENLEIIQAWVSRLDSLVVYNMYSIDHNEFKEWATGFQEDTADTSTAVNFISILKYSHFYIYFGKIDDSGLRFYSTLFKDYCFKGKNIFQYWAHEDNPMFLTVWGLTTGNFDVEKFVAANNKDAAEINAV